MANEAKRIEEWGRAWNTAYREDASRWSHISAVMGTVAAALGAAAGFSGLAQWTGAFGVSILALTAAVVTAITSSVRPAAKSSDFITSAAHNSAIADKARVFRLTQVSYEPINAVVGEFIKLCEQRDAAVKTAPIRRAPGRRPTSVASTVDAAWPEAYAN